jgi:dihydrofolate reductase
MRRAFAMVVALDGAMGIGQGGAIPWRLPGDMAYFKRITSEASDGKQNAVIMGRKTYESIPPRFRPLPGRVNVVLSRRPDLELPAEVLRSESLDDALAQLEHRADVERVFVIGGGEIYAAGLLHPACEQLYVTRVDAAFDCDTHFPAFEDRFVRVTADGPHTDQGVGYTFEVYERRA